MTKTYAQLEREIAALQASAQKQLAIEAKGAIAKINETIAKYGITAGDLKFASTSVSVAPSASKATKAKAAKGKRGAAAKGAKFSDGQGNQWGGRGPRPAWLRNAIAGGRTLESFAGGAAPAPVVSVAASFARKVPAESIASKQIRSGARLTNAKAKKTSAAAPQPSSPSASVAAPAVAAMEPGKVPGKKVAAKAPGRSAADALSRQGIASPARKRGAAQAVRASNAVKKSTGPKSPVTAAAKKTGPTPKKGKKAASKPAPRKTPAVKNQVPSAPEAVAQSAAA